MEAAAGFRHDDESEEMHGEGEMEAVVDCQHIG
jgi:hypothetical protein